MNHPEYSHGRSILYTFFGPRTFCQGASLVLCKVVVTTPITTVYNQAFMMAPIATEGDRSRSPQAGLLQGWLGSQQLTLASLCLQVTLESVSTVHQLRKLQVERINTLGSRQKCPSSFRPDMGVTLWCLLFTEAEFPQWMELQLLPVVIP